MSAKSKHTVLTPESNSEDMLSWMKEQGLVEELENDNVTFTTLGMKVTVVMYSALKTLLGPAGYVVDLIQQSLVEMDEDDVARTTD